MEEDPFESFIDECQITCSQEEKLRRCRFALEPEEEEPESSSSPPSCPVQVTGIVMVSPPESGAECVEDVFHTPPEHQSGSEDQGPEIRPVQDQVIRDDDVGGCDEEVIVIGDGFTDAETTVDLGKDSDNLGFSEPNLEKEIDDDKNVCNRDVSKIDTEMSVDLGDAYEVSDPNLSKVELGLKINKVLESDCGHSALDKGNVSTEEVQSPSPTVCSGDTEPIIVETENFNIGETEVVDLAFEGSCKEMGGSVSENTAKVDERVEGQKSGGYSASKNIEDLDAYRYVSSGSDDKCGGKRGVTAVSSGSDDKCSGKRGVTARRELPNSFKEPEVDEGLWVPRQSENDKQTFNNLLDAAGVVINDDITDSNFIKTAKEHGLTFHRPRWWPPEGVDDHVMK